MEFITRKSDCRKQTTDVLVKSPKEIKKMHKYSAPKYCIIVKPFHTSFLPYRQIIFRGVTFSDDFSIELIRNNTPEFTGNSQIHPMTDLENMFQPANKTIVKIGA